MLNEDLVKRYAAELKKLDRRTVPSPLRKLFLDERSQEYYEGLLNGYAHARSLGELIALVAPMRPARRRSLELFYGRHTVVVGGRKLQLRPADFAFYGVMARRRLAGRGFVAWDTPELDREYLHEYRRVLPEWNGNRDKVEKKLKRDGVEQQWFDERKSNVNRAILSLGELFGVDYRIVSKGARPNTRYGLALRRSCISIRDGPSAGCIAGRHPCLLVDVRSCCRQTRQRNGSRRARRCGFRLRWRGGPYPARHPPRRRRGQPDPGIRDAGDTKTLEVRKRPIR